MAQAVIVSIGQNNQKRSKAPFETAQFGHLIFDLLIAKS